MLGMESKRRPGSARRFLGALGVVILGQGLGACARPSAFGNAPAQNERVVVQNYSLDNVTVYMGRSGSVWILGHLEPFTSSSFAAPSWARGGVDGVYFVARPLAGKTFLSEPFLLPKGSTAIWTIENRGSLSHVALR